MRIRTISNIKARFPMEKKMSNEQNDPPSGVSRTMYEKTPEEAYVMGVIHRQLASEVRMKAPLFEDIAISDDLDAVTVTLLNGAQIEVRVRREW